MFGLNASKAERSGMNGSEGIGMENQIKTRQRGCDLKRSSNGKGTMTIRFNSDEEVKAFVKALEDKQF